MAEQDSRWSSHGRERPSERRTSWRRTGEARAPSARRSSTRAAARAASTQIIDGIRRRQDAAPQAYAVKFDRVPQEARTPSSRASQLVVDLPPRRRRHPASAPCPAARATSPSPSCAPATGWCATRRRRCSSAAAGGSREQLMDRLRDAARAGHQGVDEPDRPARAHHQGRRPPGAHRRSPVGAPASRPGRPAGAGRDHRHRHHPGGPHRPVAGLGRRAPRRTSTSSTCCRSRATAGSTGSAGTARSSPASCSRSHPACEIRRLPVHQHRRPRHGEGRRRGDPARGRRRRRPTACGWSSTCRWAYRRSTACRRSRCSNAVQQLSSDPNVLLVAAAGNNGTDEPMYPAAFDGVIGVGALTAEYEPAPFSNHGRTTSTARRSASASCPRSCRA